VLCRLIALPLAAVKHGTLTTE